jgi:hypothetical protein
MFVYEPPAEYCGARFFREAGLVFKPTEFLEVDEDGDVTLTDHAKDVIRESITLDRHIGVLRTGRKVPTSLLRSKKMQKAIETQLQTLTEKRWELVVVDQKSPFNWESTRDQLMTLDTKTNYLIVVMQTCTRGTDLKGWHHKIAFWHDARACDNVNLNTLLQAIRVCHYSTDYPNGEFNPGGEGTPTPQRIRLYMDPRIVKMADDDDLEAYLSAGGKPPTRTKKGRRPAASSDGWGVPFAITLPDGLLNEMISSNTNDANRIKWTADILPLLPANMRDEFEGREFTSKRTADDGVKTMHRAAEDSMPTAANPSGEMTDDIFQTRTEHFWLDIAPRDIVLDNGKTIAKGTAYVTYGIELPSESSTPASSPPPSIHTTNSSMYASSAVNVPTISLLELMRRG